MKTNYTDKAKLLAQSAHVGQSDIGGTDYFNGHLTHVVDILKKDNDEDYINCVGWLHDILEDTEVSEQDLLKIFPHEIVDAVVSITKRDSEDYNDYLGRVISNEIARIVKIADLKNNTDLRRLNRRPTARDYTRLKKYKNAIKYLTTQNRGDL